MPSRRVFAVLAVLFVVGTACSGDEVELSEASRTPRRRPVTEPTGSTGPEPGAQPPDVGREPRVGRLLDAARMAPADLARQQRGPQRRDPDPADRAELRGFGPPARRAVGLRAGHPDVLVRARPHRPGRPGRTPRDARRHRADRRAAARVPVPRDRRFADDRGDRRQPDAAPPARDDGVGRGRPQRARTLEERLALPAVADPAGRVVRARDRRHQPDLDRADACDDRDRRVPGRAPDRGAQAPDRRRPHHALGEGSRVPDGADARRPVRPGDGQRAGRGRGRDREHPPGDARPRLDVGRRRPGHRRDPGEDRGGHVGRRGFGLEPLVRPHAVLPVPRLREPGRRVRQGRAGGGRERRAARRPVADQRHRGAAAGVRHAGTDPVPDPRDRGDDPARGVRRRRHARPAVRELQDDRLHQPRVDREQPGDAGRREGAGRGAADVRGLPERDGRSGPVGDGAHGRPRFDPRPEGDRRVPDRRHADPGRDQRQVRHGRRRDAYRAADPAHADLREPGRAPAERSHARGGLRVDPRPDQGPRRRSRA